MSDINSRLNDDCLFLILHRHFLLKQRFTLRLVCRRWNSLILTAFQAKRSLKLFNSNDDFDNYAHQLVQFNRQSDCDLTIFKSTLNDDVLFVDTKKSSLTNRSKLPTKDDQTDLSTKSRHIPKLFPNIEILFVNYASITQSKLDLTYLLFNSKWRLTSLTLKLAGDEEGTHAQIFNLIASMKSLRSLHLLYKRDAVIAQLARYKPSSILAPVLSQLVQFSLSHYPGDDVWLLLKHLGQNCKHLLLDHIDPKNFNQNILEQVCTSNAEFVNNLTHLSLIHSVELQYSNEYSIRGILQLVSTHFESLTYLNLGCIRQFPLSEIAIPELNNLTHLTSLKMDEIIVPPEIHIRTLPKLSLIKTLHLSFYNEVFTLEDLLLYILFPGVEKIHVKISYSYATKSFEQIVDSNSNIPKDKFQLIFPTASIRPYVLRYKNNDDQAMAKSVKTPFIRRRYLIGAKQLLS